MLLWSVLVILVAVAVNVIGIREFGSISRWAHWLQAHRVAFFLWRLFVYGATTFGWLWMRRRLRRREPTALTSLLRVEIAAVVLILTLEGLAFYRP